MIQKILVTLFLVALVIEALGVQAEASKVDCGLKMAKLRLVDLDYLDYAVIHRLKEWKPGRVIDVQLTFPTQYAYAVGGVKDALISKGLSSGQIEVDSAMSEDRHTHLRPPHLNIQLRDTHDITALLAALPSLDGIDLQFDSIHLKPEPQPDDAQKEFFNIINEKSRYVENEDSMEWSVLNPVPKFLFLPRENLKREDYPGYLYRAKVDVSAASLEGSAEATALMKKITERASELGIPAQNLQFHDGFGRSISEKIQLKKFYGSDFAVNILVTSPEQAIPALDLLTNSTITKVDAIERILPVTHIKTQLRNRISEDVLTALRKDFGAHPFYLRIYFNDREALHGDGGIAVSQAALFASEVSTEWEQLDDLRDLANRKPEYAKKLKADGIDLEYPIGATPYRDYSFRDHRHAMRFLMRLSDYGQSGIHSVGLLKSWPKKDKEQ